LLRRELTKQKLYHKNQDWRKSSLNDQNQENTHRGDDASGDDMNDTSSDYPSIMEVMIVTMNIVPLNLS